MSDEYPKQMRHHDFDRVTVLAPPNGLDTVPVQWPSGVYGILTFSDLSPVPSPDDIVEVTVKMTRAQRDTVAHDWYTVDPRDSVVARIARACKAHRDDAA